ncbi:hypothetical protein ACFFRR_007255 [Megaselia abdita]
MDSNLTEDKTCRICGFADIKNYSLLDKRYKTLYQKILTIYPLVIYESDPLPKNICHKCLANVTVAYDGVQRVLRTQKQWIANVRNFQPNNKYVQVLDLVEKTSEKLAEEVQKLTNEQVGIIFPFRLTRTEESQEKPNQLPNPVPIKKEISEQNGSCPPSQGKCQKLEEIQNILASKGCTLLSLKDKQNLTKPSPVGRLKVSRAVSCPQCGERFPNIKALAMHQMTHINLESQNLFEKRPLEKKVRRGRLIVIQDKKCIRCLNCWKLFYDNKSILDHWSDSKCEYFCIVCGKEFPTSPRMLREHMPAAHKISFKSVKKILTNKPVRTATHEVKTDLFEVKQEPVDEEVPPLVPISAPRHSNSRKPSHEKTSPNQNQNPHPGRDIRLEIKVKCNLCNKVFANFKAKNSHMRAHKTKEAEEYQIQPRMVVKKEPVEQHPLMPTVQTGDYIPPSVAKKPSSGPVKPESTVKFLKVKSISKFPEFMQPVPVSSSTSFRLPFICQICDIKFECGEDLLYHLSQCEESINSYICMECYKQFQTPAEVQLHTQLEHQSIH